MSAQIIRFLFGTTITLAIALLLLVLPMPTRTRAAPSTTFTVNSTADEPDADLLDGNCISFPSGVCTLRAAIMQANHTTGLQTITVPSGIYLLTRVGFDDDAVAGDLDISDDLTIQGAGSGVTIIDGNGAVTGDRVFQILPNTNTTSLSGLTIRNGQKITNTFDEGGGLYWEGGFGSQLQMSNVVIEGNQARYCGGLALIFSSNNGETVDLDHVIVRANTVTAAGGGLCVAIQPSNDFVLRDSQVYSNTAYEGGGIELNGNTEPFGHVRIEGSEIYSNTASLGAGIENFAGGAADQVVVADSSLPHNHAGYWGGAVANYETLTFSRTTLDQNTAGVYGGGIYNGASGQLNIAQSTLSDNTAQYGGGIYTDRFINTTAGITVTNSTLSGNSVNHDGGGIYAAGGHVLLLNATVAANYVLLPLPSPYPGMGGGLYVTTTAVIELQNTLLGDNFRRTGVLQIDKDDCAGVITSIWYNLIESKNNCTVAGSEFGNHDGLDPVLGPLQMNGGRTATKALLPGSPAIDVGQSPACTDATGAPLLTDQRGFIRPANGGVNGLRCDIGAYELQQMLYLPLILK